LADKKCDFGEIDEAIVQVVEWSIKRYFKWWKSPKNSFPTFLPLQVTTWLKSIKRCLLASTKYDLFEVYKAMLHGFNNACGRIVCLLADPKCDFVDIKTAMFQVVENH
jgi:hypothetical protein